jgi:hypothetical protein
MKTGFIAFLVVVALAGPAFGQVSDLVRIRSDQQIIRDFPKDKRYLFQSFQLGKIGYTNGKTSSTFQFNYDILLGTLAAIGNTGDTVIVTEDKRCRYIKVGEEIFCPDPKGLFVIIIADKDSMSLAVREKYELKRRERVVSNGYTASADPTGAETSRGRNDLLFVKHELFYVIDKNNNFYPARKQSFLKLFAKRDLIEAFIKTHRTDFRSREQLKDLFVYCSNNR